jgi:hypothetical protein
MPESTEGSLGSPQGYRLHALFLLLKGDLLLFLVVVALYRCFVRPPSGVKSKRIFLSAEPFSSLPIQPVPWLPWGSFVVLCTAAGRTPEKRIFSKKIY